MADEPNTQSKPVVESFQLDHTKVKAPYVRYIDTETGPNGDVISNYDLRLVQPNENAIPTGGLHTIEHTIAVLLRERIPGYIDCSPFGCRTGFHLLTWGEHSTEDVAKALKESLEFIANEATRGRRSRHNHRKLRQLPRPQPVHGEGMGEGHSGPRHQLRSVRAQSGLSLPGNVHMSRYIAGGAYIV